MSADEQNRRDGFALVQFRDCLGALSAIERMTKDGKVPGPGSQKFAEFVKVEVADLEAGRGDDAGAAVHQRWVGSDLESRVHGERAQRGAELS